MYELIKDENIAWLWYRRPEGLIGDAAGRAEECVGRLKKVSKTLFESAVRFAVARAEAAACRAEETGCGEGLVQEKFAKKGVCGQREIVIRKEVRGRGQEGSVDSDEWKTRLFAMG